MEKQCMTMRGFGRSLFEQECPKVRADLMAVALSLLPGADDAEDAVQDTLLKLWAVRERVVDARHFRHLALSIVRQVCLNMLRSMAVRRTDTLMDHMAVPASDNPHSLMEQRELTHRARDVWQSLPRSHRIILHMKEVEHLSTEEIAALLGTTPGNVRTRLSRARKEMLTRMANDL